MSLRETLATPVSGRLLRRLAVAACCVAAVVAGNRVGHAPSQERRNPPTLTVTTNPEITGRPGREKVIFIVIDALRPDHLSMNRYARPTSPTLDRLASEALTVGHLVVHAPQTAPSVLAMLTSKLPSEHGVQYDSERASFRSFEEGGEDGEHAAPSVDADLLMMAEVFADAGFHTAGVVANPWLRHAHGFGQGYATYTEVDGGDGRDISALARQTLRDHEGEKTFLYLHYMDVHSPYVGYPPDADGAPPPFARPESGRYRYHNGPAPGVRAVDLLYTMALYDEGIYYVDQQISQLLDFLAAEDLDEDTTIVVTSDHGDEFMEHGGLGHGGTLHAELINSFAIVWNPRRVQARRARGCARGIDLLPTLLSLSGIAKPDGMRGIDLLKASPRASCSLDAVSELADEKALIANGWKLVRKLPSQTESVQYVGEDGHSSAAPEPLRAALVDEMRERLDDVISQATRNRSAPAALDAATEARLRELGYLK